MMKVMLETKFENLAKRYFSKVLALTFQYFLITIFMFR